MHQAPRILNLLDFYTHADQAAPVENTDNAGSLFNGADLNLTFTGSVASYPCFLANLTFDQDIDIFHSTYTFRYDSETASYAYYNRSVSSVEIHTSNYPLNQSWLVFGGFTEGTEGPGVTEITFDAVSHKKVQDSAYINPAAGVSPAHISTTFTEFFERYYFPDRIEGTMNRDDRHAFFIAPVDGETYKVVLDLTAVTTDPDDPDDP